MRGRIDMINHKIGWVAICTESGTYCVAEVLEMSLPGIGDIVQGDLEALGGETFYNETAQEELDVFVQDLNDNQKQVMQQLKIYSHNKNEWEMF